MKDKKDGDTCRIRTYEAYDHEMTCDSSLTP